MGRRRFIEYNGVGRITTKKMQDTEHCPENFSIHERNAYL
jgi:hypothetical protein